MQKSKSVSRFSLIMTSVVEALCALFNCSVIELKFLLRDNKHFLSKAESFLKSHILLTNYHEKPKRVIPTCIMRNLNSKMAFAYGGKNQTSVEAHYYSKYKIDLKYPYLPVILLKEEGGRRIYPLEVLNVEYEQQELCEQCHGPFCWDVCLNEIFA